MQHVHVHVNRRRKPKKNAGLRGLGRHILTLLLGLSTVRRRYGSREG